MSLANKIHINRPMTNISIAYIQSTEGFVANKIFPEIPVEKQADKFFIYDPKQYLTNDATKVAPGAPAPLIQLSVESGSPFYCETWKLRSQIPIEYEVNADLPLQIQSDTTQLLTHKMLINKELNFVNNFFKTGCWGLDLKGGDKEDSNTIIAFDKKEATPIEAIELMKSQVQIATGQVPNTLVIARPAWRALKNNQELMTRILYKGGDNPAMITRQTIASLFELDNIYVMDSIYNPGKEGTADIKNNAFMGGKSALLCYVPKNPGLKVPASGYTFSWNGLLKAMNGNKNTEKIGLGNFGTKMYWNDEVSSTFVECWDSYDQKIIGKDLGIFINNIVS